MKKLTTSLLPLLLLGAAACKKEPPPPTPAPTTVTLPPVTTLPPVGVTTVTLGNTIGPDKHVSTSTDTFTPRATLYAVVDTSGAGPAKLRALWTFVKGEKTAKVDETVVEVPSSTTPVATEFHVSKPSGWPKGDYKVEIFLNDGPAPVATKAFKVGEPDCA